jgi:hypothetical protein
MMMKLFGKLLSEKAQTYHIYAILEKQVIGVTAIAVLVWLKLTEKEP